MIALDRMGDYNVSVQAYGECYRTDLNKCVCLVVEGLCFLGSEQYQLFHLGF